MTDLVLTEHDDRWSLPVAGQQIIRCCTAYAAVLLLLENGVEFSIEAEFLLIRPAGQRHALNPQADDGLALAPILGTRRRTVGKGAAFKDGRLVLEIDDGSRIEVPAGLKYEPWNLTGPGGLLIVSVPGGDLSIWLPRGSGTTGA